MSSYFIYYTEASIVCVIIFAVMLARDLFNVDRQEKQIKYDRALIAFALYFISDAFWAAIIAGILPTNTFTVVTSNFANCLLMSAITYTWLRYVMAVEQVPKRDEKLHQFAVLFPFLASALSMVITFIVSPHVLFGEGTTLQPAYYIYQITVPCIYIAAVIVFALKRALTEENLIERKKHLYIGFFPLMVVVGGLIQILLLPETPIFCFCSTILMLVFYIHSMETLISTDPLTQLNNRGQLLRFTAQKSNLYKEGHLTFVLMLDINDFKAINDTYGHAEGDRALVLVADALKNVVKKHSTPIFLARYGGDEFILIIQPAERAGIEPLIREIRAQIDEACCAAKAPYALSVGIGCDELEASDSFQQCMQRADEKLYLDKDYQKKLVRMA